MQEEQDAGKKIHMLYSANKADCKYAVSHDVVHLCT